MRSDNNVTTGERRQSESGNDRGSGAKVNGVTANNVDIVNRDGVTSVVVKDVQVGATQRRRRGNWQHQHCRRAAFGSRRAHGRLDRGHQRRHRKAG